MVSGIVSKKSRLILAESILVNEKYGRSLIPPFGKVSRSYKSLGGVSYPFKGTFLEFLSELHASPQKVKSTMPIGLIICESAVD